LGIINLITQNDALLLKNLQKFFNRLDCPWVNIIWENYYRDGKQPNLQAKGYFWWRDILKLLDKYKGIAMVIIKDGAIANMRQDMWNGMIRMESYPELFSFATRTHITVQQAHEMEELYEIFQLLLTIEAFQQYSLLSIEITSLELNSNTDEWKYILGSGQYSVQKAYRAMTGHMPTHPIFQNLWASKCQPKHTSFGWLLLHNKLNTRERLRSRHMALESCTCENCILKRPETTYHLFLRCNFAKMCWTSIRVATP
jgi:hypothetical protein